jgi:hypothetical protein
MDLSGFGGSYENNCQIMLHAGLKWLEEHPEEKNGLKFEEYKNIYGVIIPKNQIAKQLESIVVSAGNDCTGAMVHAVIGTLLWVAKYSWSEFLVKVEKEAPDRIYEWDGTIKSAPITDLSLEMDKKEDY